MSLSERDNFFEYSIMLGIESIREVIAFPKNKAAESLMDSAPNVVDTKQLDELGLSLKK